MLGQEDPDWTAEKELCQRRGVPYVKPEAKKTGGEDDFAGEAELLEVGQRCECTPAGRRGTIRSAPPPFRSMSLQYKPAVLKLAQSQ